MQARQGHRSLTHEELLGRIREIEDKIPHMPCRPVPSSFDPNDPLLSAFPAPSPWIWKSLETFLRTFNSRGVLSRMPLFWQLESPLNAACRAAQAICFLNDAANMPLGAAALKGMHMDTVVTDLKDAREFSAHLAGRNMRPHSWVIIHSAFEDSWDIPELNVASIVAHEVHLFPGVPLLEQCGPIVENKQSLFHHADAFAFERYEGSLTISDTVSMPMPIQRYALPFDLEARGQCPCGKTLFART